MQALQVLSQQEHTLSKPAIVLRDLWKGLEVARKYSDWADDQLEIYTQGVDFVRVHLNVNPTNNLLIDDHAVTLEVAKHIALMSRTEQGRKYRQQLIDLEAQHSKPLTMTELLVQQAIALDKAAKELTIVKQTQQAQAQDIQP